MVMAVENGVLFEKKKRNDFIILGAMCASCLGVPLTPRAFINASSPVATQKPNL
jgi:hypothetical protein